MTRLNERACMESNLTGRISINIRRCESTAHGKASWNELQTSRVIRYRCRSERELVFTGKI